MVCQIKLFKTNIYIYIYIYILHCLPVCVCLSPPPVTWPHTVSISHFSVPQQEADALSQKQQDANFAYCQYNCWHSGSALCHLMPGEKIRATSPHPAGTPALLHLSSLPAGEEVPIQLCLAPLNTCVSVCVCLCVLTDEWTSLVDKEVTKTRNKTVHS